MLLRWRTQKISDTVGESAALTAWQTNHCRPRIEESWAIDHMALTETLQSWVLQVHILLQMNGLPKPIKSCHSLLPCKLAGVQ